MKLSNIQMEALKSASVMRDLSEKEIMQFLESCELKNFNRSQIILNEAEIGQA